MLSRFTKTVDQFDDLLSEHYVSLQGACSCGENLSYREVGNRHQAVRLHVAEKIADEFDRMEDAWRSETDRWRRKYIEKG